MAVTSRHVYDKFKEIFGLPDETVNFTVICKIDSIVRINVDYYPNLDGLELLTKSYHLTEHGKDRSNDIIGYVEMRIKELEAHLHKTRQKDREPILSALKELREIKGINTNEI